MQRKLLFLSTVLLAISVAHPASASEPIRRINPGQEDVVIKHQCAFPVFGHIDGIEIIDTFIDDARNPVKQIVTFPGNVLTLTNMDSGTSVTILGTGSSQLRAQPDGSTSGRRCA